MKRIRRSSPFKTEKVVREDRDPLGRSRKFGVSFYKKESGKEKSKTEKDGNFLSFPRE